MRGVITTPLLATMSQFRSRSSRYKENPKPTSFSAQSNDWRASVEVLNGDEKRSRKQQLLSVPEQVEVDVEVPTLTVLLVFNYPFTPPWIHVHSS